MSDDDFFNYDLDSKAVELDDGFVSLGDDINIMDKDPTVHLLMLGLGWDLNPFDGDELDLDVSLFLLDKNGQTRIDEDFVFYNNMMALDGAIKHHGDNRTGAGEGDDENISIDLHGIPFDIISISVVLSIYQGYEREQKLGGIKKSYIRLVNEANAHELLRYNLTDVLIDRPETAMVVATIDREGPKWHFRPKAEFIEGGLEKIAKDKGMLIIQQ